MSTQMMDMYAAPTNLIIVCADNTQKYGNYLMQLIGLEDDEDGKIVGIPDGTVTAAMWTEKDFAANRPQIPSSQRIIFIGDSKNMKAERANMNCVFEKYGMHIDQLGKRMVMYVDEKAMNKGEYSDFLDFAQAYQKHYDDVIKKISSTAKKATIFSLLVVGGIPGAIGSWIWNWAKQQKEITDQRYGLLMLYSYLEVLNHFVGD